MMTKADKIPGFCRISLSDYFKTSRIALSIAIWTLDSVQKTVYRHASASTHGGGQQRSPKRPSWIWGGGPGPYRGTFPRTAKGHKGKGGKGGVRKGKQGNRKDEKWQGEGRRKGWFHTDTSFIPLSALPSFGRLTDIWHCSWLTGRLNNILFKRFLLGRLQST